MKALALNLVAAFCALFAFGQNVSVHAGLNTAEISPMIMISENPPLAASSEKTANYAKLVSYAYRGERGDECIRYKKQKTLGIIFASVGGGLFITGCVMTAVASADIANNNNNNYYYGTYNTTPVGDIALEGVGATFIVAGLAGMGVGIPFAIIGSVKYKKHCGGGGRSQMEFGTNGSNLALKF